MIDLIYLAHGRREFTRASFRALVENTNWSLVRHLEIYTDGHRGFPHAGGYPQLAGVEWSFHMQKLGGPVAIMRDWLARDGEEIWAKIDNDVIVPPGWLDQAVSIMQGAIRVDLLGLEPPASRTPSPGWRGAYLPAPEFLGDYPLGFAPCDMIGGVGLLRRSAFAGRASLEPFGFNGVGGFSDWQMRHPEVSKAWIVPPLKLFLLDRLPLEPWVSLSREYIAAGVQRPWTAYPEAAAPDLWDWWNPAVTEAPVGVR